MEIITRRPRAGVTAQPARGAATGAAPIDRTALAADLAREVRGEVRFDAGSRALYATDASNYRQTPIGVVLPRDEDDVVAALAVCRRHGAPVLGRGGGTSLAGQCCNDAVVFDLSKYLNQVVEIDVGRRIGIAQPGTILDDLRARAERHGLTFGPDPATHNHCTLGGMVGNDSCGIHSVMAANVGQGARTADNIEALDIVTYDGVRMRVGATSDAELDAIVRAGGRRGQIHQQLRLLRDRHAGAIRTGFPQIPRRVSGYNLPYLLPEHGCHLARALVGSESTCVMVLRVYATLIPSPAARVLMVLGYPDVYEAADHIEAILAHEPIGLEGMDDRLVRDLRHAGAHVDALGLLPEGGGWLLVEFGGQTQAEALDRARHLSSELARHPNGPRVRLLDHPHDAHRVWAIREAGLGVTAHVTTDRPTWPGWEDSAVPPARLGEYLRALRALFDKYGYQCDLYGHFGQGCVHTRVDFDLVTAAGIATYRRFLMEAADLVVRLGGSLSGEHGDGQARGELLPRMFSPELMQAFREFKSIWDPEWKMNPGKVIDAARVDEHLRLGAGYDPPDVRTAFAYPRDKGSFAHATLRCVGVGECRRLEGGTMCPSFRATREEQHSTRGRARLLFEMLRGDPLEGGWQAEPVRDALDLCLACKGCKGDCPVNVDMATYKAEFLSHYYAQHRRPVRAYAFGLIHYWARAASRLPRMVNLAAGLPGVSALVRRAIGMTPDRALPAFAPFTFTDWFRSRRKPHGAERPTVVLWPDTFNNHFHPQTAMSAVRVLESAGYRVAIPPRPVCCGRPLYDYGMLDTARAWLERILDDLGPFIEAGVPVVGLEPSCVAVFRDELGNMLPERPQARRLAQQTFLLSEFLERTEGFRYPTLYRKALVHGHCHHKAVLRFDAESSALSSIGLDVEVLDSGCCGLAGAFGFERGHSDVADAVGELVLAPAVRSAPLDTLIVADGFSCREQIRHLTNRRALHLADVLEMAAREGPRGPAGNLPERTYVPDYAAESRAELVPVLKATGAGVAAAAGALAWAASRRRARARRA